MIDNSKFLLYFRRVFPIKHPMEAFEYITCWPHRIHRKFKNRGVFWISLTIYNARGRYLKQPLKVICTVLPFIGLIEHTPRMRTPWLPWVPIKSVWYHATISDPIEHSPPGQVLAGLTSFFKLVCIGLLARNYEQISERYETKERKPVKEKDLICFVSDKF